MSKNENKTDRKPLIDENTAERLISQYGQMVKSIAVLLYKNIPRNEYDLDDLVQLGMIEMLQKYKYYNPKKAKESTFIFTVIRNRLYTYMGRMKCFRKFEDDTERFMSIKIKNEYRNEIIRILKDNNLSEQENQILDMLIEGKKQAEIARELNVHPYVVGKVYKSIKERLIKDEEKAGTVPGRGIIPKHWLCKVHT